MMKKIAYMLMGMGALLIMVGGILWLMAQSSVSGLFSWFGRLPGDIRIERDGFTFFFPLTSMLLISLAINILIWLIRRLL